MDDREYLRDLVAALLTLALGAVATYAVAWEVATLGRRLLSW